ncbi:MULTISPECIES: thiamine pyrophosphate-dependent enzyme [unclassified Adlercreutzia]|uniref:thiamine pyrophosphate-dependent enzyme n=1 Tax=unclassified Adlercreutzia TaxID=2636013 RepID=UPI001F14D3DE|nr:MULTISPECIES: thiamine pyrophosphate-dependent enzyme [unclassified Adlercreutzia]
MTKKLLMGNEAFAHAALEAGVRVVAGYPGTPSSEVIETVAKRHAAGVARGVHVEWSTNEKAALEVVAGAAYCGARVLFTCKQVGLNVASDALMSLNYVGVRGGTVLFVADDPGPISSQTEQDTRRFAAFAKVPVLDPSTPDEGFAMMKAAFELSERYYTPVIVRPTTRICHASTFFDVADETEARPVPTDGFAKDPKWVIFPRRSFEAHGEINERLREIARDFAEDPAFAAFNPVVEGGGVSAGSSAAAAEVVAAGGSPDAAPAVGSLAAPTTPATASGAAAAPAALATAAAPAPRLGILAGGVSAAYAREALAIIECEARAAGAAVPAYRFMQVGTPYPFPADAVARFAEGLDAVLVLEELDYVLEDELLRLAGARQLPVRVLGKLTGDARDRGENTTEDVALRIARFFDEHGFSGEASRNTRSDTGEVRSGDSTGTTLGKTAGQNLGEEASSVSEGESGARAVSDRAFLATLVEEACTEAASARYEGPLPVRPPVLCAGCPHRGSFYAVKRALGKRDAVLCGDIGCYTLGNAKPLDAVDTCLCMGAGITMAQGFAVAEPHKKQVAFVGDSTFFASGITGIVNAVYNGHDITVAVLDNATTAMTGSQPHPGTGVTLMGPRRKPVSIEGMLRAMGVECITFADPLNLEESLGAAREAIDFEGPSAIIFRSPCIQLKKPEPAVLISTDACTGCKKCITEIGCPGIGFDADAQGPRSKGRGQAFVDASLCNGCALCTQVCPFEAITVPAPNEANAEAEVTNAPNGANAEAEAEAEANAETAAACHPERAKRVEGSPSAAQAGSQGAAASASLQGAAASASSQGAPSEATEGGAR